MDVNFNGTTAEMLKIISDYDEVSGFAGAYNIREDSKCAGRRSSENITIESKEDKPGINIRVKPFTVGETVFIPACVTHSDVDDLVYNDFYIGEGADVVVVAGCGVHNDGEEQARHNGIHRFFLEKGARVLYKEKHIGTGKGTGLRKIDPVTDCVLDEDSYLEMDTIQLRGVDRTTRSTSAVLGKGAKIVVRERIMTDGDEEAVTKFHVELNGEDSGADLVSRSVATVSYTHLRANETDSYLVCRLLLEKNKLRVSDEVIGWYSQFYDGRDLLNLDVRPDRGVKRTPQSATG